MSTLDPELVKKLKLVGKYPETYKIFTVDKSVQLGYRLIWEAQPGMQQNLFLNASDYYRGPAEEILIGGRRGGGKTAAAIAWLAEPIDNPQYIGLLVRETQQALRETMSSKCDPIWCPTGAKRCDRPVVYRWPNGAQIFTAHLSDLDSSVETKRGNEYHRIVIEEGCQIGNPEIYERLVGSLRSTVGIKPRICVTANPDGPGNGWVKARWVRCMTKWGVPAKHGEPFTVCINPDNGARSMVRLFLPGGRKDNPALENADPKYWDRLEAMPEHIRRAWIDGDWDAGLSLFFPEFRPTGPINEKEQEETPHARHVVPAHELPPWCHRWAAMDLGYDHHTAALWGARGPDKRLHVYREMVLRKHSAEQCGAEFAKRTLSDLQGLEDGHMNLWLSHEAFATTIKGDRTIADDVKSGIESILGPSSAFVMRAITKDTEGMPADQALNEMLRRRDELGGRLKVTIHRVRYGKGVRATGFSFLRTLLRFKAVTDIVVPNQEYLEELRSSDNGHIKAEQYIGMFSNQSQQALPRLWIHDCCPVLADTIPRARPDPDDLEDVEKFHSSDSTVGDDPLDALRFLVMAYKDVENTTPYRERLREEVERFTVQSDGIFDKYMAAIRAAGKLKAQDAQPLSYNIPRESAGTFLPEDMESGVDLWV